MIPAQVTRMSSRPARLGRGRDRRLDLRARRDVAAHGAAADRGGGLLRCGEVEVRDDDVRALRSEPRRGGGADPARPAGDERHLAGEPVGVAHRSLLITISATHTGLSPPSRSTVVTTTACSPPGTSSTEATVDARADPRAGRDGRREPHLVGAVVDAHRRAR